jgi:hypothetical protein
MDEVVMVRSCTGRKRKGGYELSWGDGKGEPRGKGEKIGVQLR